MDGSLIPWMEWGEAAFARARAENKPILLHIGATWCHWCHVMDEGTYAHPTVARLVAERFVPVRVDTDHRPDVNDRYNHGGWPTVAVLDARGEVMMGRTYTPAGELAMLLQSLADGQGRWSLSPTPPEPVPTEPIAIARVREALDKAYDPYHGGFGDFQKFPHPDLCEWLLDRRILGEDDGGRLAKTLDGMADGGMYDPWEGGWHRYATHDDWSDPHYEKMLEDTARLVRLYTRAATATGHPGWRRAAEKAVRWALEHLWLDDAGAFGGSQDADEGYYALPLPERRDPPRVDRTVYAGWNGLMITALVRASAAWDRPGLAALALRVGATLRGRIADGRVSRTGAGIAGLLTDQIEVAEGNLALFQLTGDPAWRDGVATLAWARDHLAAPGGGLADAPPELGLLRLSRRPMVFNAHAADAAWRLGHLTGDAAWLQLARAWADAALAEAEPWGFMAGTAARAGERIARKAVVVKVNDAALLRALLADPDPDLLALADASVPAGHAMACSGTACARPVATREELARAVAMLKG
ncbi:MAG: DUF255 domain-containing protein [Myxococcota bacterium]